MTSLNPVLLKGPYLGEKVSPKIDTKVNNFVESASNLANQILAPDVKSHEGPIVIRNHYHYYHPSPWYASPWFYPQPTVVVVNGRHDYVRQERREKEDGCGILIGVIATIGALFASYAIGCAVVKHNDAKKELDATHKFQRSLSKFELQSPNDAPIFLNDVNSAAKLKERICSRIKNSAVWDLALRISVAVGLGVTALGAFIACPPLLAVGAILTVATLAGMLFKWGFESSDKANKADAQALQNKIFMLKQV